MVRPHQSLHLPDQVAKNLQSADTVKVLGWLVFFRDSIAERFSQLVNGFVWFVLITCDPGQCVSSHLRTGFHQHFQVRFRFQVSVDQITHRFAHGNGPMAVAELTVVEQLKPITHAMVFDGIGVYQPIRCLDMRSQVTVEPILIDTLPVCCTMEASKTATGKREFLNVDDFCLTWQTVLQPCAHIVQAVFF